MERLGLFARLREFLPPPQCIDIVEPDLDVVGFERLRAVEQELRIVENAQLDADLRQQPHAFDIARIGAQEMAADFLCPQQPAFVKMVRDRDQVARERGDTFGLRAGRLRLGGAPAALFELGQRAPARIERGIEPCGAAESGDGGGDIARRARKVPGFLPCAAVFGHGGVERRKVPVGLVEMFEITRRDRGQIQRFAIGRIIDEQRLDQHRSFGEIARLQRLLRPRQPVVACRHCLRPLQRETAEANPCSPPPPRFPKAGISSRSRP